LAAQGNLDNTHGVIDLAKESWQMVAGERHLGRPGLCLAKKRNTSFPQPRQSRHWDSMNSKQMKISRQPNDTAISSIKPFSAECELVNELADSASSGVKCLQGCHVAKSWFFIGSLQRVQI
jgi:hypothetical protein